MATDDKAKQFFKRYTDAKKHRELLNTVIDECYEFAAPLRDRPYASKQSGEADLDRLFDSTAPGAAQDLASEMLDDVWPTDGRPFDLKAGSAVTDPGLREQLDLKLVEVADEIIETVNNSNFRDVSHKALIDWEIGSGYLLPEEGDFLDPVRFRHLPLPDAIPVIGPFGFAHRLYQPREVEASMVRTVWPNATITDDLARLIDDPEKANERLKFIEAAERDYSTKAEAWTFTVAYCGSGNSDEGRTIIEEKRTEGAGSKPFVDFHYMLNGNDPVGRGPLQLALPDIKSLNLLKQYVLEAGDLALGGMWQIEDDGVLNVDTIQIAPRTIIPRASGSKGLERIDGAANYQVAEYLISSLQNSIKSIMFGDDLGPAEGTPMTATEVLQRTSNRARRRAGPYTQLLRGLMFQTVQRVAFIRQKQGVLKPLRIDGRNIQLRPLSPLTRAQAQDEVLRHARFMELGNQLHGPQQMALAVDAEKAIDWLGGKMGSSPQIMRPKIKRKELAQAIAMMAAQAQAGGAPVA